MLPVGNGIYWHEASKAPILKKRLVILFPFNFSKGFVATVSRFLKSLLLLVGEVLPRILHGDLQGVFRLVFRLENTHVIAHPLEMEAHSPFIAWSTRDAHNFYLKFLNLLNLATNFTVICGPASRLSHFVEKQKKSYRRKKDSR